MSVSARTLAAQLDWAENLLTPRAETMQRPMRPDEMTVLEQLTREPPVPGSELDKQAFEDPNQAFEVFQTILNDHYAYRHCARALGVGDCPEQLRGYVSDELIVRLHRRQRNWVAPGDRLRVWRLGELLTADDRIAEGMIGWFNEADGCLDRILNETDYFMFGDRRPPHAMTLLQSGMPVPGLITTGN